jgi:hypothetical protein
MTQRIKSLLAVTIALLAIMVYGSGWRPAAAQQKNPLAPTLIRNIDEPGFNIFQQSQNILFTNFSGTATLTIPAGKVVVIEHASASGGLETGGTAQLFLRCANGDFSEQVNHSLVLFPQGQVNGITEYSASQPVKCYAISPGSVSLHVQSSNLNTAQHTWVMAISGYTLPQ